MKYKYYLGPSGSGKSYKLKQDIIELSKTNPDKNYYLIVPDQYTMQEQVDMVKMHDRRGILNIDVLSFGRLTHKVFDEVGVPNVTLLDDTGKNLILRKVSIDIKESLPYLGTSLSKPGYIHQVKSAISEFMQYGYSPEDIDKIAEDIEGRGALKAKLADLSRLYDHFQKYKEGKYITTEENLEMLAKCIEKSDDLNNSVVAFDGFTGFTPVQKSVLYALFKKADELWFSFSWDSSDTNLFDLTKKTIRGLDKLLGDDKNNHLKDVILKDSGIRYASDELTVLEKQMFRKNAESYKGKANNIKIYEAKNPLEEVENICIEIKNLVKKENYAYRDVAVVTGDLENYTPFVERIFDENNIPLFVDQNRHLKFNPFTEFIKCGLNIIKQNFSYQSVMAFLRTGMTEIKDEDIDCFDNYLLALKIRGYSTYKKTFTKIPRSYRGKSGNTGDVPEEAFDKLNKINMIKSRFLEILDPLISIMGQDRTVTEYTSALISFVENNDSENKLNIYKDYFNKKEDFVREKEYGQVYGYIIKLLEQCKELLGDEKMDIEEYALILEAGISEIKVGVLPGETDYVLFGDIERSRLGNIKALFFIGVNDGIIPKNVGTGGIISDIDRTYLFDKKEVELAPTPREQMFNQRLYLYMNMTKPSTKLYMSYSRTGNDGKSQRPSYLVEEVKKIFGESILCGVNQIRLNYPSGNKSYLDKYALLLKDYANGVIDESNKKVLFALNDIAERKLISIEEKVLSKIKEAAFFVHEDRFLSSEIAKGIYGITLRNSVSRLEKFASCAYAHFLEYGLKLEEREEFEVKNLDMGNIYHKALEEYALYLEKNNLKWGENSSENNEKIVSDILDKIVPMYNENIFYQDERCKYQIEKMKRIISRSIDTIGFQQGKSSFAPRYLEMGFKHTIDVGDIKTGLSDEEKMMLVGKVDRVDTYEKGDDIYVKVIDYKSSEHKIDFIQFYNGLSLQLVVYLDRTIKKIKKENPDKNVHPAAMYYFTVTDPLVETKNGTEDIDSLIKEKMKMSGLTLDDKDIVDKIAGEFDKKSDVINVTKKTDGEFDARSEVLDSEKMDILLRYSEYKTKELSEQIAKGNIAVSPCDVDSCTYCSYRGICGFDVRISGYKEKTLENPGEEIFEKMKEKIDGE